MKSKIRKHMKTIDGTLIVDIDGTVCENKLKGQSYDELVPRKEILNKLAEYQKRGYKILLYTARNMNTYNNNLGLINKYTAPRLIDWLDKWKVPYDEILFGKPWPKRHGFYVDDRAIRPDEFLRLKEEEIQKLLGHEL